MVAFKTTYQRLTAVLFIAVVFICFFSQQSGSAVNEDVLSDPLVFGAWLWASHCNSCHGPYGNDRIAGEYEDKKELVKAIEKGGCQLNWAKRFGGRFNNKEIKAVTHFMLTWEAKDKAPELPELPPLAQPDIPEVKLLKEKKSTVPVSVKKEDALDPSIRRLMETNPVAQGAYLYTHNCYRCHLSYEKARMGKGVNKETIHRTVTNGKTSTQMKAFSRMKGGKLKSSEINAVVIYIMTWEELGTPIALAEILLKAPDTDPAMLKPIGLPQFQEVTGNLANGRHLLSKHCVRCHGVNGHGHIGRPLNKEWWVVRADLRIKSIIKQGVRGSAMLGWTQGGGGKLSAKDVDDLVAFVVSL